MNRCLPFSLPLRHGLAILATLMALAAPAQDQTSATASGVARAFPDTALRGQLAFTTGIGSALVNGEPIRTAPGFRLFSPQSTLIFSQTVQGQTFIVNYVIEPATGLLLTAWILTKAEAAMPGKNASAVQRNYGFASDSQTR